MAAAAVSQKEFAALLAAHRQVAAELEALKLRLAYVEGDVVELREQIAKRDGGL